MLTRLRTPLNNGWIAAKSQRLSQMCQAAPGLLAVPGGLLDAWCSVCKTPDLGVIARSLFSVSLISRE